MLKDFNMSLLRNWSKKVKQNETHDDPAPSSSKEHEEEPAGTNYLYIYQCFSRFSCSYFVLILPNSFFRSLEIQTEGAMFLI